jgi:adenosyl cobinamide kinase/adenosyl cobinamide phosphate guanylyltransferase
LFAELETELTVPLLKLSEGADLVIVTGDVHSEGSAADAWTDLYMQLLGKAGCVLAAAADRVVEAVSGVPVVLKT